MSHTHSALSATKLRPEAVHPNGHQHLGGLLLDATLQFRDLTALIEMDRKKQRSRWTFDEVRTHALRLARRFETWGYGPGDRLAILMTNQPAWLVTAFAAFLRGMVLVPLDWKLTAEEQAALLRHAKPKALLVEAHHWPKLVTAAASELRPSGTSALQTPLGQGLPEGLRPIVTEWTGPVPMSEQGPTIERWEEASDGVAPTIETRRRDDLACIVYSSGTGGRPKGCMLTHDNYLSQLAALMALFPTTPNDRFFSVLPTNHAIDFLSGFIGPMATGAIVVHQRTLRPEFLLDTLRTQRITQMAVVPMLLEAFERALDEQLDKARPWQKKALSVLTQVNQLLTDKKPNHGLSKTLMKPVHEGFGGHLKLLFAGGAFVDERRAKRFYDLGIPVVIGYGLTECTTVATVQDLAPFRADTVGRAVAGVEIRIDAANDDGIGEVWIRGKTVMKGYLDDPDLTAETLIPAADGGLPWLKTGDLGRLDAARHLILVGRKKNMIVTAGGKNVYPEDLEVAFSSVGAEDLAIFAENYVWGAPPKVATEGGAALTHERLVVVARGGDFAALKKKIVEANKRQPEARRVHAIVKAPAPFPRTASMKVKREELARVLAQRVERGAIEGI
jgi:long-chain acyl-CoA synthetase